MTTATPDVTRPPAGGWRSRVPRVLSIALTVLAVLCAAAAVGGAVYHRTQWARIVVDELFAPAPANLGYAAFIGVLAAGVARRKRITFWMLLVGFSLQFLADLALFAVYNLIRSAPAEYWEDGMRSYEPWLVAGNLLITAAVLVVLATSHRQFYARVQRASVPKALATLVVSLLAFSMAGWALVETFPGSLKSGQDEFSYAAEKVTGGAFVFDVTRPGRAPGWVNLILGLFGAIALFAGPVRAAALTAGGRRPATPRTSSAVRTLLAQYGERDSLGYFATRRDKAVDRSRRPARRRSPTASSLGVCLASGDPIGDPEAWAPAIEAWLEQARAYAWTPAVMGASEDGRHRVRPGRPARDRAR